MSISMIAKTLYVRDFKESNLCGILQKYLQDFPELRSPSTYPAGTVIVLYTFTLFSRI